MSFSFPTCLVQISLAGLLFLGCDSAAGRHGGAGKPIVIQISRDGAPVSSASVDLSGQGGGAALSDAGEAKFAHVPFGSYRVVVVPQIPLDSIIPPENPEDAAPIAREPAIEIPRKFRDEQTTPLEIEVGAGAPDRFEFDLQE